MSLEDITERELKKGSQKALNTLWYLYNKGLGEIPWEIFNSASLFLSSEEYISEVAKNYIRKRINKAEQKGRINATKADYLYSHLDKEKISPYLVDIFMHTFGLNALGLVTIAPYFVYGPLRSGDIGCGEAFIRAQIIGAITRTVWTTGRIIYECLRKENIKGMNSFKEKFKSSFKKRSIALKIGAIPNLIPFIPIGLFGYPIQMIHSEYKTDKDLGDFLLDDSLYEIEKRIPIIKRIRKNILNKIYKD